MSTIIKLACIDQTLALESTPVIASGGLKEDFIQVAFCGKWDGLYKTAVFWRAEDEVYHVPLDDTYSCEIPPEVLTDEGYFYFGLYGVGEDGRQRTSEVLRYTVVKGAITSGTKPSDPTPDLYTQLLEQVAKIGDNKGKADKVASPTAGGFAGLDKNGNLLDLGLTPADFSQQLSNLPQLGLTSEEIGDDILKLMIAMPENSVFVFEVYEGGKLADLAPELPGVLTVHRFLEQATAEFTCTTSGKNYHGLSEMGSGEWSGWKEYAHADQLGKWDGGTISKQIFIDNTNVNGFLKNRTTGGVSAQVGFGIASYAGRPIINFDLTNIDTKEVLGQLFVNKSDGVLLYDTDAAGAAKYRKVFTEKNKPEGSYSGTGSATAHTVNTGGIGNLCFIYNDTNDAVLLAYPVGSLWIGPYNDEAEVPVKIRSTVTFSSGVLSIKSNSDAVNASGVTYYYRVL